MLGRKKLVSGLMLSVLLSIPAFAVEVAALNESDRAAIMQALKAKISANYIEPAVAERVVLAIESKHAEGGYASAASAQALSEALAKDLREFSNDKHFGARVIEGFRDVSGPDELPTRAQVEEWREQSARGGYGIEKIERLPGNVGYIELRNFGSPTFVGQAYTAAMTLLAGTDALILDLRRNGGGSPRSAAYLISHFFPFGDIRHLSDMYVRPDNSTEQFWTVPTVALRYDKPVYVLTSARTFSAGEDFSYNIQAQKRGALVGETTGGGSNPVGWYSVGHNIAVAIPDSRTTNFVTKTNWNQVGVKPDIGVPAAQALQTAHVAILSKLLSSAKDDNERTQLQRILTMVENGEAEKPVYTLRGER
ncbi:MAG TPA: S41 family peptidase [Pseudoduganella sp.]